MLYGPNIVRKITDIYDVSKKGRHPCGGGGGDPAPDVFLA